MTRFKKTINATTIKTLVKFEVLYKLLLGMILLPCATFTFEVTMKVAGYRYLVSENIASFLKNPLSIMFFAITIIILIILILYDAISIIIIQELARQNKKISLTQVMTLSFQKCKDLVLSKNIAIAFLVFLFMPFLNLAIFSNIATTIRIPELLLKYVQNHTNVVIGYFIGYLIIILLLFPFIYALHYMVIEKKLFKESCRLSKTLIKNNYIKDFLKIILIQIIFAICYVIILSIGIILILIIGKLFEKIKIIESILLTIVVTVLLIASSISNAITYSKISSLFYLHKYEIKEPINSVELEKEATSPSKNRKIVATLLVILAFTGGCLQMFLYLAGRTNFNIETIKRVEVTAHRGASKDYPENTMLAFEGAKEYDADWIELDVQQTKDREIVVSHDSNLSRVAGINKEINDINYEELKTIDVGSHLNTVFSDARIPKLDEVIDFAKENNIRLNIELKPTGKEIDFENQVIEIIKEKEFENRCVITSQVYQSLEKVKRIDPTIKTIYVMSIAVGEITQLDCADGFSIESINANKKMVNAVHQSQKELLVWTVNSEENIRKMIELGVDNIITDDVQKCKALVAESRNSDYIKLLIKRIS